MPFPSTEPSADPTDPTSQIAWPARRTLSDNASSPGTEDRDQLFEAATMNPEPLQETWKNSGGAHLALNNDNERVIGVKPLTKWNLFTLSIGMAGAQVAWTIELGYGTPFLLSLGLSEQLTSLVWLAGPISGLVAQPVIGAVSDSSSSRYRRRFWISWSTIVLVVSCLTLAYAESIASVLIDIFGGGVGDWDPESRQTAKSTAIGIAITAFYLLDFSLNALQASLRNLLLDVTPAEQLSAGNAWHGRMTHAGNIVGFGCGFLNLAGWPVLRALGGNQFRKFCVVGIVILVVTVWVTCWTQNEPQHKSESKETSGMREILGNIHDSILNLPKPIRKICFVQLFAFMAWFPFLFYATTYVGQVMAQQGNKEPDVDVATRAGNFAMLMYSLVAVVAGSLLPELTRRDERLLGTDKLEDEEAEMARVQKVVRDWDNEATAQGRRLKLPKTPLTLQTMWSFALLLYGVISLSTFFINTVGQATVAVALVGICWAVAVWVPFAMIMEFLKEIDENTRQERPLASTSPRVSRRTSSRGDTYRISERTALLGHHIPENDVTNSDDLKHRKPVAGGTVLGIHNLAIVLPQFIIALVASLIFRIVDKSPAGSEPETIYLGKNGVAWVLRFGGLSAFLGAIFVRLIPLTNQEKRMRRELGLMRDVQRELYH